MSTRRIFITYGIILALLVGGWLMIRPSNDRTWTKDQMTLSRAEIDGNLITVRDIRNFAYESKSIYNPSYYDKTFDLTKLVRVWFVVEPFASFPGAAHTLLSFEFEDDEFLAISVEIRKERGELFSPLKGLLKQYELMYVAGDERDLIKLRSNYRKDDMYVYPARASKVAVQELFLSMVTRMNAVGKDPEFYNTITNTCMTNIVAHINEIAPQRVPIAPEILLPAESDRLAYELGLIDTDLSFAEAREYFHINERAELFADSPDFSRKIRERE